LDASASDSNLPIVEVAKPGSAIPTHHNRYHSLQNISLTHVCNAATGEKHHLGILLAADTTAAQSLPSTVTTTPNASSPHRGTSGRKRKAADTPPTTAAPPTDRKTKKARGSNVDPETSASPEEGRRRVRKAGAAAMSNAGYVLLEMA